MTDKEKQAVIETDARLADLVYDYAWRNVERSTDYFGRIDSKATTLTGIVGVTLTILLSSASLAFPEARWGSGFAGIAQAAYALSVLLFIISLAFGIRSLSLRGTTDVPSTRSLIDEYKASSRQPSDDFRLKKTIAQRLSEVDFSYCYQVNIKNTSIRKATLFLKYGLVFLTASIIVAIAHISITTYDQTERPAPAGAAAAQPTSKR